MKFDLIISGVGGQGILTIAFAIGQAAIDKNLRFKQSEVHGMSVRGGDVYSHLRLSETEVKSDLIPIGGADIILSLEPLEVFRYLKFLNPKGVIITSSNAFNNINNYPNEKELLGKLLQIKNCIALDTKAIALAVGVPVAQNMAILGAALPYLPFDANQVKSIVRKMFEKKGEHIANSNVNVLETGHKIGQIYKGLQELGKNNEKIYSYLSAQDPLTIDLNKMNTYAQGINQ